MATLNDGSRAVMRPACRAGTHQIRMETVIDLLRDFPNLAIIAFCTSPGSTNLAGFARSLGATKAVREPVEPSDLVIAVEEMLP